MNNSNLSDDAFNFDYAIPLDQMMDNAALFDTTAAIPDNLFEFITNDTQSGFTPAPEQVLIQPTNGDTVSGKKRDYAEIEQEAEYEPPNQAMFAIIVGGKPFRLSWESIKSDGPKNFFTEFFRKRKSTRIMHVDRDPDTFSSVVHHLRGYHIRPRDDIHNQSLLCDASYYGLQRLWRFLQDFFFVNVGGRSFRLAWSLFNKDKQVNFFTGPVKDHLAIPNGNGIQTAPYYIDRDPDIFMDIITYLRGYTIRIRDEVHHKNLLKDATYYALKGLRAQLLTSRHILDGSEPCDREILLHLQSVRPANLVLSNQEVQYKHDSTARELLVQISHFDISNINITTRKVPATFSEGDKRKLRELGNKLSECGADVDHVIVDDACAMTVDDCQIRHLEKLVDGDYPVKNLTVQRAIAKVQVENGQVVLWLLRFEALSSKLQLNMKREFLSG